MSDKSTTLRTRDGDYTVQVAPSYMRSRVWLVIKDQAHVFLTKGEAKKLAAALLKAAGETP